MENIREIIEKRYNLLECLSKKTEEKIKSYPKGSVFIKHYRNNAYYYYSEDGTNRNERTIDKSETEYLQALIQRYYLEKVLKAVESEMESLRRLKRLYPKVVAEEVYERLSDERKPYVKPIVPTDEQYVQNWLSKPYIPKPISDDVPIFKTMKGERVRSKSEQIIADRLYVNGIPYKYECPQQVGDEIFHPDFTILRIRDRRILYYEHCGRMDDAQYANDMVGRSRKFELAGFRQGDNLFYSFESSVMPLDVRVIDQMINTTFK